METICLLPEKRDALCKALGVSKRTYYNAVNGKSNFNGIYTVIVIFVFPAVNDGDCWYIHEIVKLIGKMYNI